MNDDFRKLFINYGAPIVVAAWGWIFRTVRKYLRGLRYAQADISTIWLHLELPRKLRSGSYRFPKYGEEEEE